MRPTPVFESPWHAQLFAITVALNEAGHFVWAEWTMAFGTTLRERGLSRALNGGEDYFQAWLATLEPFLAERDIAASDALGQMVEEWRAAYLRTPHGAPVTL